MNNFFHTLKENILDVIWSLGTFGGYDPSLDPFHAHLVDLPRKIMWTTFFNHSFDFSKAFDKFKRVLDIIDTIVLVFSYLHAYELCAHTFDKLLHALIASELVPLILICRGVVDAPQASCSIILVRHSLGALST